MKKYIVLLSIIFTSNIFADVINIPSENFSSIQSAIDSSQTGDTVLVAPGVYYENVNFIEKNIVLTSHYIFEKDTIFIDSTIINGNNSSSVITINSGEDSTTHLIGFTITNGNAKNGAGIYCENSSPVLSYLKLVRNTIDQGYEHNGNGGGIFIKNSSSILKNLNLSNNNIYYGSNTKGGGIYIEDCNLRILNSQIKGSFGEALSGCGLYITNSTVKIDSCIISDNEGFCHGAGIYANNSKLYLCNSQVCNNSSHDEDGGGILLLDMIQCELENIVIGSNWAQEQGGGLYMDSANGVIENCIFINNRSDHSGGAGYLHNSNPNFNNIDIIENQATDPQYGGNYGGFGAGFYLKSSSPKYDRCLFYKNKSIGPYVYPYQSRGYGSGIYCEDSSPHILNSTITENECSYEYDSSETAAIESHGDSNPIIVNSILWNNDPSEIWASSGGISIFYSNIKGSWPGDGNINSNPLFVDSTIADFHLSNQSPSIDKGISLFVIGEDTIVNIAPSEYFGSSPDMGKYEFDPSIILSEDMLKIPQPFELYQNYPNPFNPTTTINYALQKDVDVKITIYNILGQEVKTLINGKQTAGYKSVVWNGTNQNGDPISSGMYIYKIIAGDFVKVRKMLLIR